MADITHITNVSDQLIMINCSEGKIKLVGSDMPISYAGQVRLQSKVVMIIETIRLDSGQIENLEKMKLILTNTMQGEIDNSESEIKRPPAHIIIPFITGSPAIGEILGVDTGTWVDSDGFVFTYQWYRETELLNDETDQNYTVLVEDVGFTIFVVVTVSNSAGTRRYRIATGEISYGGLPPAPVGYAYIVDDNDGSFIIDDNDGSYLLIEV